MIINIKIQNIIDIIEISKIYGTYKMWSLKKIM
jgi:hypothetical protein